MLELFQITDANGFTTASYPSIAALNIENLRANLKRPLTVRHWHQSKSFEDRYPAWVLKETFQW